MKKEVIQNIEDFLNDFQYFRLEGNDVFQYPFQNGGKLIVLNTTPYEDGLILEVQLAVKIDKIEELIFSFYQKETDKLSLTYRESLSQISLITPKRNFIQNENELSKVLPEIEDALVKKGFNWLDELSNLNRLSNYLFEVIFDSIQKPSNLFKLCQRSYLIKLLLGENITDATFYNYYELLQFHTVPEHQLEEFIDFKNYLKTQIN